MSIPENYLLDELDAKIITAMSSDSRRSYGEVGAEVGLSTAAVHERVKKMLATSDQKLELVAEMSGYQSANSLWVAFKQTTGVTPIQFLTQRRIERAKRLLADSELPLADVALSAGFKNQSHFSTLFRKFTESTPKAWRNAYAR